MKNLFSNETKKRVPRAQRQRYYAAAKHYGQTTDRLLVEEIVNRIEQYGTNLCIHRSAIELLRKTTLHCGKKIHTIIWNAIKYFNEYYSNRYGCYVHFHQKRAAIIARVNGVYSVL